MDTPKTTEQILKDYALSSLITFISAFALFITADPTFNLQTLSSGAAVGVIMAAVRAGAKAVIEYYVAKINQKVV